MKMSFPEQRRRSHLDNHHLVSCLRFTDPQLGTNAPHSIDLLHRYCDRHGRDVRYENIIILIEAHLTFVSLHEARRNRVDHFYARPK